MTMATAAVGSGADAAAPPIVQAVLMQHVGEAAHLRQVRSVLVRAAHVRLHQLAHLDDRMAAHLNGIAVAGEHGVVAVRESLDRLDTGTMFVATVRALEDARADLLEDLLVVAETISSSRVGVLSAFGWVAPGRLRGLVRGLLLSASAWRRELGLAACAMHGADPGPALARFMADDDPGLRARALRDAGRQGRVDQLAACLGRLNDADTACALAAAWSAALLGDRGRSLDALEARAVTGQVGDRTADALAAVLKVLPCSRARSLLTAIVNADGPTRAVVRGAGVAGDPYYVPWLIAQMHDAKVARVAGEAFASMTGLELADIAFERAPPPVPQTGPSDDPEDEDVALDEDDSLLWPDPEKIDLWWRSHGARFAPGSRYFMGAVPTPRSCIQVLRTGSQRQRLAAAEHATLLTTGTPLFDTSAPAWRQQRLLDSMPA